MNQSELAAGLVQIQTQVGKVAKEQSDRYDALLAAFNNLKDQIENGPVKQEVADALAGVQTALQAMDDSIPDAPAT